MITNKTKYLLFIFSILLTIITSCEKEIDLEIPSHESKLVVEGWIEQGKGAKVILTLSAPYFTNIDSSNLRDYAVTQAKVTVSNDSFHEILTLKPNDIFFPPYYYFGSRLTGEVFGKYKIEIVYRGRTYIAETTIPDIVPLDSVWFEANSENDTLGLIGIQISDNINDKNYYRVLTKRLGKDNKYIPTFTSVFSDELFNGKSIGLTFSKGNASLLDIADDRYFNVSDTVIVKFCSIDKEHYEFWNTIQSQIINSANPFSATNNKISSNIDEGFGIWGGYAAWYDTVYGLK
jgi:hypothetical protein